MKEAQNPETDLIEAIASFYQDPVGFVYFVFPWGEPGILEDSDGPDQWQLWVLEQLASQNLSIREALQIAVASGHGIGKTALVAWIILWFISTRTNPEIVVTANTESQLQTKTWREVAKWRKLAIHGHWLHWSATKLSMKSAPETWFAAAIPWSEKNPEAFAGTHERDVLMIFDEASAISDIIWETAEGAMTTPGCIWIAFGNMTRTTGRFVECFGKFRHRWRTRHVDSRTAKMTDKRKLQEWVDDYGEDSDFVRIRVRGVAPRAGSNQFISSEDVEICRHYEAEGYEGFPLLVGVDIARFGDDRTIFRPRQGRKLWKAQKFRGLDIMQTAAHLMHFIDEHKDRYQITAFVDAGGIGAGVIDRCRQMGYGRYIVECNAGIQAHKPKEYFNKRAEIWGRMRAAIQAGLDFPADDQELLDDLIGPEYGFDDKNRIQLEKKKDMKRRGLASPDDGDALALTYWENVLPRKQPVRRAPLVSIA